jgi:hypothetical protein
MRRHLFVKSFGTSSDEESDIKSSRAFKPISVLETNRPDVQEEEEDVNVLYEEVTNSDDIY